MLTNPPFTRQKGEPPLHSRDLDDEERAQWTRMREAYGQLTFREPPEPQAPADCK